MTIELIFIQTTKVKFSQYQPVQIQTATAHEDWNSSFFNQLSTISNIQNILPDFMEVETGFEHIITPQFQRQ